ncbi:MAG: hypothetical protein J3Q66DRAFT_324847 [Benniella sp.]|nr:MAG: hypothetical protein J3Q66DRAFT_324847 [Benniella sp.]
MENYHRRSKSATNKFESYEETGSGSAGSSRSKISTQEHNRPQQHGVMLISPNGKIRNYVTRGLEVLTEADNANDTSQQEGVDTVDKTTGHGSPPQQSKSKTASGSASISSSTPAAPSKQSTTCGVLTIKAQGRSITKAVTVAEILKRRMQGDLHQFTEIGQITEQEIWDPNPDKPKLAPITVTKHRPTIRIRLSKHLDTGSSSLTGIDPSIPGASIPRNEHADDDDNDNDDGGGGEAWPGAILNRDAAARRLVGYQAPTGNDIYL